VAIGHRAFFRREGEIVDTLIVREPGTTVELFDLVAMVGVYFSGATAPTCLYTVPTLTPKRRATSLTQTSES
jgi:hypothetical protein